ncbi:acyl-CoA carboxylase epsilon subunit [Streptomyces sp. NBC_00872]|uniref:acyl-CoA carboxylase epsilon subunit n=1 Tax=Streptomyces sp. NBC_00872 TaxID=2903686 RepID=UPI0038661276|nr:acyl-CoA carboxylase subunit epsilon [Streptomyces sp. NBC_00872]
MIKVVRGKPTREELAAALAVVQARAAAAARSPERAPEPPAEWSSPTRIARHRAPSPGPRAWARTYWPG